MPRKRTWEVDGITVTRAHVRLWMQSVAHRVPERQWSKYIAAWAVPHKVARELASGTFLDTVHQAAANAGVKLRKPRSPNRLTRIMKAWPMAANE